MVTIILVFNQTNNNKKTPKIFFNIYSVHFCEKSKYLSLVFHVTVHFSLSGHLTLLTSVMFWSNKPQAFLWEWAVGVDALKWVMSSPCLLRGEIKDRAHSSSSRGSGSCVPISCSSPKLWFCAEIDIKIHDFSPKAVVYCRPCDKAGICEMMCWR